MNQIAPTPEHRWRLMDATRRLMHNKDTFLSSAAMNGRSIDKIKEYNFANYLSSIYSLQDVVRAYAKAYAPDGYYAALEIAIKTDDLLNYMREARISQDHTLSPSATQPIVGFVYDPSGRIVGTERGKFQLYPIVCGRSKGSIPVPTSHKGNTGQSYSPEDVVNLSYNWWAVLIDNLASADQVPTPFALPS